MIGFGFRVIPQAIDTEIAFRQIMHNANASWTLRSLTGCVPQKTIVCCQNSFRAVFSPVPPYVAHSGYFGNCANALGRAVNAKQPNICTCHLQTRPHHLLQVMMCSWPVYRIFGLSAVEYFVSGSSTRGMSLVQLHLEYGHPVRITALW